MDSVGFRILPTPGFTIDNFVVGENPAFGDEPFLRANTVICHAARQLALARTPGVCHHLARRTQRQPRPQQPAGQWNFESILLPASQTGTKLLTAPTDQRHPGGNLPRFPYIEATQARVNYQDGHAEKKPFSLTDAKLALLALAAGDLARAHGSPALTH